MSEIEMLIKRRLSQIKYDCKTGRRHSEFTFTVNEALTKYKQQDGKCALTGWTLEGPGGSYYKNKNPRSLSFDRIDPDKGYTNDNIMFVCTIVNNMRGNMLLPEFKELCEKVANARY